MNLTSKQRAYLGSLANTIDPIFQIGKSSLTPEIISAIDDAIEKRELIKVAVLKNCIDDPKEIAAVIGERTHSTVVKVIGKKIILYREARKNPKIKLPEQKDEDWNTEVNSSIEIRKASEDEQRLAEQEKEKKKQSLTHKYGLKYAQDIIDGKASVGMSKEMCKEALGSPDEITKSTNSSGSVEIWVYSLYHKYYPSLYPIIVVTFTNEKVTSVNEYTDSNYIF